MCVFKEKVFITLLFSEVSYLFKASFDYFVKFRGKKKTFREFKKDKNNNDNTPKLIRLLERAKIADCKFLSCSFSSQRSL